MRHANVIFAGKSGVQYHFQVWDLEARFRPVGAVYFVTKRAYDNITYRRASHDGIYIGQTGDLFAALSAEADVQRYKKHGANSVCVHLLADETRRIAIEQDLLAVHSTHCNHEGRAARIFIAAGAGDD